MGDLCQCSDQAAPTSPMVLINSHCRFLCIPLKCTSIVRALLCVCVCVCVYAYTYMGYVCVRVYTYMGPPAADLCVCVCVCVCMHTHIWDICGSSSTKDLLLPDVL
jgi:hypothetical protein